MSIRNPDGATRMGLPPSEVEEAALDRHPLIAACFLHPDHPGQLEFDDIRMAVADEEECTLSGGGTGD